MQGKSIRVRNRKFKKHFDSYEEDGQATGDVRFMPDNKPSVGAQSFMEDGEGDEANCNGGIFVDTGGITINGGFGGGGSGKCTSGFLPKYNFYTYIYCKYKEILNSSIQAHVIPLAVGEATPVVVVVQTRASQAVVDPLSMRILPLKRLKLLIIMVAVQLYSNYCNFNNKITQ